MLAAAGPEGSVFGLDVLPDLEYLGN